MSARNTLAAKAARREARAARHAEMERHLCPICRRHYSALVLHTGACGICFTGVKFAIGVMGGALV